MASSTRLALVALAINASALVAPGRQRAQIRMGMGNSFGRCFRISTWGESHGGGVGAREVLKLYSGVEVLAYVQAVQDVRMPEDFDRDSVTLEDVEASMVRCPHPETAEAMIERIDQIRRGGNSIGGVVECVAYNVPAGLGAPVFDKLEAELAKACMSLPASKGFEIGSGFGGTLLAGKDHNDEFYVDANGRTRTRSNRSGGVQGGISNGETIWVRVAFKPTSTIGQLQNTVTRDGKETELRGKGRHDLCVLPRAAPMVESMVALVLADALMQQKAQCDLLEFQEPSGFNALGATPPKEAGVVAAP